MVRPPPQWTEKQREAAGYKPMSAFFAKPKAPGRPQGSTKKKPGPRAAATAAQATMPTASQPAAAPAAAAPKEERTNWGMPLSTAVELVRFQLEVQIQAERFLPGRDACGAPTQILAINSAGLRWIDRPFPDFLSGTGR